MTLLAWIGFAVFVVTAISFFWLRKKVPPGGIIGLTLLMIGSLAIAIASIERKAEKVEAVWFDKAIQWKKEQLPLTIYWNEIYFAVYNHAFDKALETWNERVGCHFIKRISEPDNAYIQMRPFDNTTCGGHEAPEEKDSLAHARYCDGYVDIQLKKLAGVGEAFRIALHEVGHAIGLDHDIDQVSAMSPKVIEPQAGTFPEHLLPSNRDVAEIRKRFCPVIKGQP